MKIVGSQIQQIMGAYQKQGKKVDETTGVPSLPTDQVDVSDKASAILAARQAYSKLPDVREDKVADIQAKLQSGTYTLDNTKIAESILKESG